MPAAARTRAHCNMIRLVEHFPAGHTGALADSENDLGLMCTPVCQPSRSCHTLPSQFPLALAMALLSLDFGTPSFGILWLLDSPIRWMPGGQDAGVCLCVNGASHPRGWLAHTMREEGAIHCSARIHACRDHGGKRCSRQASARLLCFTLGFSMGRRHEDDQKVTCAALLALARSLAPNLLSLEFPFSHTHTHTHRHHEVCRHCLRRHRRRRRRRDVRCDLARVACRHDRVHAVRDGLGLYADVADHPGRRHGGAHVR